MSETAPSPIHELLGPDLLPLYHEYQHIVDDTPKGTATIAYYPEAVPDQEKKARDAIAGKNLSPEEESAKLAAAATHEIDAQEHALLWEGGFAGTITKLFKECVELEAMTPEEQLRQIDSRKDFAVKLRILRQIPAAKRKGANVAVDGYYFAGSFTFVAVEA